MILCCRAVSTKVLTVFVLLIRFLIQNISKAIARVTSSAKAALDAERKTARAVSLQRGPTAAQMCAMEGGKSAAPRNCLVDLERETVTKILIVLVTLFVERTTVMVPDLENATTVAQIFDFYSKYQRSIFHWQLSSGFERIFCARLPLSVMAHSVA